MIVKDYKDDLSITAKNSRYAIILGHYPKTHLYNFFVGPCMPNDQQTSMTASRLLDEKTGGIVKVNPVEIETFPYVYCGNKQLYILKAEEFPNLDIGVNTINNALKITNIYTHSSTKEVDKLIAVTVPELLSLAKNINKTEASYKGLSSRTAKIEVEIEGSYMQILVTRLNELIQILNHMYPSANF